MLAKPIIDMNNINPFPCAFCVVLNGNLINFTDRVFHPDMLIREVIEDLINKLNLDNRKLEEYIKELGGLDRATLHRFDDTKRDLESQIGDELVLDQELSKTGIKSGSKICLVITTKDIPLTIRWSAGSQTGSKEKKLATDKSIRKHIESLIDEFQLRDWIDGPMKSDVALCHQEQEKEACPALPEDQTLRQLKVRAGETLHLKIKPRFLPVTIQVQSPTGKVCETQQYLPVDKTIEEICEDLRQKIPEVNEAINGEEKCRYDLQWNGAVLRLDESLSGLQVPENAVLQLVLTPTFAKVKIWLPTGSYGQYIPVQKTLSLKMKISELINTIVRDHQLSGKKLVLAASLTTDSGWEAEKTLADYNIKTGAEIWVRQKPQKAQVYPPFIFLGGAALAVVVIIAIVLIVWLSSGQPVNEVPPVAPTTSAPIPSPVLPTPLPTPTLTADEQKRYDFAVGLEAYDRQDWPAAAEAFKRVFATDPAYLDVGEKLAATHYNWAVHTLTSPEQASKALAILQETFVYSPTHQLGRELEAKLDGYVRGVGAVVTGDLETAVAVFEQVAASDLTFLDVAARLYEALMALSRQQREANQLGEALATCTRAAAIPNVDTSAARQCVTELQPTPTPQPTSRPQPNPREQRLFVYRKDHDPNRPWCISVRIVGIDSSGWYFIVDGLGYRGDFRGGDSANCQLQPSQEVTFSIYDAGGRLVRGGGGIPAKGGDIFIGEWRR